MAMLPYNARLDLLGLWATAAQFRWMALSAGTFNADLDTVAAVVAANTEVSVSGYRVDVDSPTRVVNDTLDRIEYGASDPAWYSLGAGQVIVAVDLFWVDGTETDSLSIPVGRWEVTPVTTGTGTIVFPLDAGLVALAGCCVMTLDAGRLELHGGVILATPTDRSFELAGPERGPVAYGPRIGGADAPRIVALVCRPTDVGLCSDDPSVRPTIVTQLPGSYGRTWQKRLNEVGSGSLTLTNDDPDLPDVHDGDVIRMELHGEAAMSRVVTDGQRTSIAEGEEIDEVTQLSGPGRISILSASLVYPVRAPIVWPPPPSRSVGGQPVEEDRVFSWTAVDYHDETWGTAESYVEVHDGSPAWWGLIPSWPPTSACWIWAPGYSTSWAPSGVCYFRKQFTLGAPSRVMFFAAADDSLRMWVDSALVINRDEWYNTGADIQKVTIELDAGTHAVAALAGNSSLGIPLSFNPSAFACVAYTVNNTGDFGSIVLSTDNSWKIVTYPVEPPGVTAGEVTLTVLGEANQRRGFPVVSAAFNGAVDSDGNASPTVAEISTKVGNDVLTLLTEMAATYVDFEMEPACYRLWLWVKDRPTVPRSVNLHAPTDPNDPTSGNLTGLIHHRVT